MISQQKSELCLREGIYVLHNPSLIKQEHWYLWKKSVKIIHYIYNIKYKGKVKSFPAFCVFFQAVWIRGMFVLWLLTAATMQQLSHAEQRSALIRRINLHNNEPTAPASAISHGALNCVLHTVAAVLSQSVGSSHLNEYWVRRCGEFCVVICAIEKTAACYHKTTYRRFSVWLRSELRRKNLVTDQII